MNQVRHFVRSLTCLFRRDCNVFQGDDFTRWLERKGREADESAAKLRATRKTLERTNPLQDALLGRYEPPRRKP